MSLDIRPFKLIVPVALVAGVVAYQFFTRPNLDEIARDARRAVMIDGDKKAIEKVRDWVRLAPESAKAWQLMADAAFKIKDTALIAEATLRLESLNPEAALQLWLRRGSEEMKNYHAAEAERSLRRALKISSEHPEPWRLLAQLLSIQCRPRETSECLMNLIRLNAFSQGDLLTLAWPNSAIADRSRIEAMLTADPQNLVPKLSFVGEALNENRVADAETILQQIVDRHPECSRAVALLGLLLAERDAPEFLQWQMENSAHASNEPETLIAQGIWLRRHGQPEAASRSLWAAVELDPRNLTALSELGHILKSTGQPDLSAAFLEWSRRQQEITEISRRIEEQGDLRLRLELSQKLEAAGRIWEAWAWLRLFQLDAPVDIELRANEVRLKNLLSGDMVRTRSEQIPGRSFRWSDLPTPVWPESSEIQKKSLVTDTDTSMFFYDEAESRGINFRFINGAKGQNTIVQTGGGGVAAIDLDQDGWCDLYLTQGGQSLTGESSTDLDAVYRNVRGENFIDVTAVSGAIEGTFSQGVATGDVDNDGFPEIYVGNLGRNRLFRNNGDGTFCDITREAGLDANGWTTSCAIADLNRDSQPEIIAIRYAYGEEITSRACRDEQGRPGVCRPTLFPAESDLIAINSGDGTFSEFCSEVGLDAPDGRGFGLVVGHFNRDSLLDVFVANDQTANFLFLQDQMTEGPMHFSESAVASGVAFDRDGFPQACMGVASTDLNSDGLTDLFITNFADESNTLYESQTHGGYLDTTREAQLRDPGFRQLGFGTQFFDADLDGFEDLAVLNGHILDAPDIGRPAAMRPQLYRGVSGGRFVEKRPESPEDFFSQFRIGRGLCRLDWNRDGRQDLAASFLDGNAALITNQCPEAGNWLSVSLKGVTSSRDAIGARLEFRLPDGAIRRWVMVAGDGFAASNERSAVLGLGQNNYVDSLTIEWPSGKIQEIGKLIGNTYVTIVENHDTPITLEEPRNDQ